MTQLEREELIERYLDGQMTPTEESEFFLHAAVDGELQRTLKAFRIMDRTIQADKDAAVSERSPYRAAIMGMLAATPAVISGAGAVAGSSAASTSAAAGASSAAGMAGLGLVKLFVAALVGGALVFGAGAIINSNSTPAPRSSQDAPAPRVVAPQVSAPIFTFADPTTLAASAGSAADAVDAAPAAQPTRASATARAHRTATHAPAATTAERSRNPVVHLPEVNRTGVGNAEVRPHK